MARKISKENKARFALLRDMGCSVCAGHEVQIHHIIGHGTSGMGMRSPDELTIPLCFYCHDALHRHGHKTFERKHGSQMDLLKRANDMLVSVK